MANFSRQALKYDYFWTVPKKNISNYLPGDVIDRTNGYSILNFINRFMAVHGLIGLHTFNKLEWMICKYVPHNLSEREEIEDWLRKNWAARFYY